MAEQPITDDVAAALCKKLKKCDLTKEERRLLAAIIKIARDVTGSSESFDAELDEEFDKAFEPGQAGMILAYLAAQQSITKTVGSTSITRASDSITGRKPHHP